MKFKSNRYWFVFNANFTKCYQFRGNKLMWTIK